MVQLEVDLESDATTVTGAAVRRHAQAAEDAPRGQRGTLGSSEREVAMPEAIRVRRTEIAVGEVGPAEAGRA